MRFNPDQCALIAATLTSTKACDRPARGNSVGTMSTCESHALEIQWKRRMTLLVASPGGALRIPSNA